MGQRRRKEVELDESVSENHGGALSSIIDKELKDHVKQAVDFLPERQKLSVILRAYEGMSCEETARVMGCSEGAVKAHYHNGVKRLREILKERGYEINS